MRADAVTGIAVPLRLDFLWAALCLLGAVYFVFRGNVVTA